MPAGDKTDSFSSSRKWLKAHTQDLSDPKYARLTSAERGVLIDLQRYSLRASDLPGFFLYDGEPMQLTDILRGIQPRDIEQDELNRAAIQGLREQGWLTYSEELGWALPRWREQQSKDVVEPDAALKKKIEAAARQRRRRGQAEGEGNVVPMRRNGEGPAR